MSSVLSNQCYLILHSLCRSMQWICLQPVLESWPFLWVKSSTIEINLWWCQPGIIHLNACGARGPTWETLGSGGDYGSLGACVQSADGSHNSLQLDSIMFKWYPYCQIIGLFQQSVKQPFYVKCIPCESPMWETGQICGPLLNWMKCSNKNLEHWHILTWSLSSLTQRWTLSSLFLRFSRWTLVYFQSVGGMERWKMDGESVNGWTSREMMNKYKDGWVIGGMDG